MTNEVRNNEVATQITYQQLKDLDACQEQLDLFSIHFGESLTIHSKAHTELMAVRFFKEFDSDWFAFSMFKEVTYQSYRESSRGLWNAFEEAGKPLYDAYLEAKYKLIGQLYWEQENKG